MERLTVGNNPPFPGRTTLTRVPPPSRRHPPAPSPERGEDVSHKEHPNVPHKETHKETPKERHTDTRTDTTGETSRSSHPRERAGTGTHPLLSALPSPDRPLLRLMGRDIYPEDLMLVLLILTLKEDNADPGLVAALIYLLFC